MVPDDSKKWLLLIHQLPPKPEALRVRVWRRLQQVGAVAIKQSVYALPLSEHSREDLSWILKEIIEGGGDGSISEARFLEGLTDEQVVDSFHAARQSDYRKIIQEGNEWLTEWSTGRSDPQAPALKGPAQVAKLRRRLDEVLAIDFFQTPDRGIAEALLQDLTTQVSGGSPSAPAGRKEVVTLQGRTWVTRRNLFVDRLACGWLIRRFIDNEAVFKFVRGPRYAPQSGELRFDMFDGEFTHEGNRCTFEAMVRRFRLPDRALLPLAEIVHDIDLKDKKYGRSETSGFSALLTGLVVSHPDDEQRLDEGIRLFENLFAYFQRRQGSLSLDNSAIKGPQLIN
jgi:hypothetical protein